MVVLFPQQLQISSTLPVVYWLVLIVFIDVAHVYSTLYRTYFNPDKSLRRGLLLTVPLICYVVGVVLHSFDAIAFWRVLAYLAVYHFIRQQYGFMRLYSRKESSGYYAMLIDKIAIYTATIYPILYWHAEGNRQFNWFVENDFFILPALGWLLDIGNCLYIVIILAYLIKEVVLYNRTRQFNLPRNILIAGTFLSWYFGIIYFNGDLAFTTLNVISHGIPYMALIWIAERKKPNPSARGKNVLWRAIFNKYGLLYFLTVLVVLAYLEEGLWDGLVWKEHKSIFQVFNQLPKVEDKQLLSLIVPLLALPQSTHYVLDGFIWKNRSAKI
ncbi:hypothetical protein [Mucilaginibacter defluvii]|uniref:Uncharacterized protein n=1 Tax=Mucilaginibacter defluvii TaxID=1196019 RepID=A0ABP9G135_9SPHI